MNIGIDLGWGEGIQDLRFLWVCLGVFLLKPHLEDSLQEWGMHYKVA